MLVMLVAAIALPASQQIVRYGGIKKSPLSFYNYYPAVQISTAGSFLRENARIRAKI
jgi:hypothetical protein